MNIYYKCAPDGTKKLVLSYVYDCGYWYTSEDIVKCFMGNLGKIFYVRFLVYSQYFMPINISQM